MSAPKLQALARLIAKQESELAALRRRLEGRLGNLHRRREDLRTQLREVEAEIDAASPPGAQVTEITLALPEVAPPTVSDQPSKRSFPSLGDFLINLVREGNGMPVPLARLKAEAVRQKFPSTSNDLPMLVKTRVYQLVRRGQLRRDPRNGGLLLPGTTNNRQTLAEPRPAAAPRVPKAKGPGRRAGQRPLHEVLRGLLQKAKGSMAVADLAEQALKAGYRSTSKSFKDVIWVALGNMKDVEHDPEGGYRLTTSPS